MKKLLSALGLAVAALVPSTGWATPISVDFTCIAGLPAPCATALGGATLTIDNVGTYFQVVVSNTALSGIITDYYTADKTGALTLAGIVNGTGISFSAGAPLAPPNLPGGNDVGFVATIALSADSNPPPTSNGIANGDGPLTVDYSFTGTFADLVTAVSNGDIAFGLHVQSLPCPVGATTCDGTTSVSLLSEGEESPPAIPEPNSLSLLAIGLCGLYLMRREPKPAPV